MVGNRTQSCALVWRYKDLAKPSALGSSGARFVTLVSHEAMYLTQPRYLSPCLMPPTPYLMPPTTLLATSNRFLGSTFVHSPPRSDLGSILKSTNPPTPLSSKEKGGSGAHDHSRHKIITHSKFPRHKIVPKNQQFYLSIFYSSPSTKHATRHNFQPNHILTLANST